MTQPVRGVDETAALRHGRWQMVILAVALVVVLVRLVPQGETALGEMTTQEYLQILRPWTSIVVAVVDVWAVLLVVFLIRARPALRESKVVRSAFLRASSVQMFWPMLPGLLIWGWYGLPAGLIGLACLAVTLAHSWHARAS